MAETNRNDSMSKTGIFLSHGGMPSKTRGSIAQNRRNSAQGSVALNLRHSMIGSSRTSWRKSKRTTAITSRLAYDTSQDKHIVKAMKLGKRWEDAILGVDQRLNPMKLETIAALKIQSHWRSCSARRSINRSINMQTPPSKFYSREVVMLRLQIFELFDEGNAVAAYQGTQHGIINEKKKQATSVFILFVIVFSIVALVAETIPELMPDVDSYGNRLEVQTKSLIIEKNIWKSADTFCTMVFSAEFFMRLWVSNVLPGRTVREFTRQPMNVCDFLAISPWYIENLFKGSGAGFLRVLRAIRLVRLFRIFKLGRYSTALKLMFHAVADSIQILFVLLFFLFIGVILFSSIIFYFERISCPKTDNWGNHDWEAYIGECEDSSYGKRWSSRGLCCDRYNSSLDFPNIGQAIWWNLVTMTTVGYGDIVPRTAQGQIVASLALLAGILLIALPVAVVGRKFQETYDLLEGDKAIEGTRSVLPPAALSGNLSDPTVHDIPFVKLVQSVQALRLETEDTEFFLKLKNLQRLIDQSVAAEEMVHKLNAAEKLRQQKLYFTFQKLLQKFLKEQ